MKKERQNPYATNEGGKISALHEVQKPVATTTKTEGGDLRSGR